MDDEFDLIERLHKENKKGIICDSCNIFDGVDCLDSVLSIENTANPGMQSCEIFPWHTNKEGLKAD